MILRRGFISIPSLDTLDELRISESGDLDQRGDHNARAAAGATLGSKKYTSSRNVYRHLNHIQELIPVRHKPLRFKTCLTPFPERRETSLANRSHLIPRIGYITGQQAYGTWD